MLFFRLWVKMLGYFLLVLTPVTVFLRRDANTDVQPTSPFPPAVTHVTLLAQVLLLLMGSRMLHLQHLFQISFLDYCRSSHSILTPYLFTGILPVCPTHPYATGVPLHVLCLRTRADSEADTVACPRLELPSDTSLSRKQSGKRWMGDSQA